MQEESSVLMVSGGEGTNLALRKVLNEAGIHVCLVRSCAEAQTVLKGLTRPAVLFSDTALPDGTWADVLALANQAERHVPVVVVSRVVDINLYISALEKGASDFIVPPFYHQDISHILKCAAENGVAIQTLAVA
jgi:DNA-binding NtrC family response regulator